MRIHWKNKSFACVLRVLIGALLLLLFCEYVIYYVILHKCDWPKLRKETEDPNILSSNEEPVRIMILADTHLLGSFKGHWFDKLRREWQMHRAFQTAVNYHKPELIFVLGDLTDEGQWCSDEEFKYHVNRFYRLFSVPKETQMYFVVGNHDIGFHYATNPHLNERFIEAFNSPAIQFLSVRGNHFVLINSMALEGDGCFLCKPAEMEISKIEKLLKCTKGVESIKCSSVKLLNHYSRPILLQHFPLYRESDADCKDFDSAPYPLKNTIFREAMDCLSQEATYQIVQQLQPRLAISGHTHHGCTRSLPNGKGQEITIPSFSWRNKDNPTYGLMIVTPNNSAFLRCAMPKESLVISIYTCGGVVMFIWLLISRKRFYLQ